MKMRVVLAAAAAALLGGCNMFDCGGAADTGHEAGGCTAHTTFLASHAAARHPVALTKS